MAGNNEISAKVKIDGAKEAVKDLQTVGKEGQKLDGEVYKAKVDADTDDAKRDIGQIFEQVDKLGSTSARIVLQDNAKSIRGEITDLLIDLDRLDANDPQVTIKVDQINALEGQLGQIEAKVDTLGTREIDIQTGSAKRNIDELGQSADSSKSVLANMVGNSVQDIGALGGVAGSAGAAIGQMGEYMADATASGEGFGSVLKSFSAVALPLAGIAAVTKLIGDTIKRFSDSSKRSADDVDAWSEAMRSGVDAAGDYADALADVGDVTVDVTRSQSGLQNVAGEINSFFHGMIPQWKLLADVVGAADEEVQSILPTLADAGITVDSWTAAIEGGATGVEFVTSQLAKMGITGDDAALVLEGLAQAQENHAKAAQGDAEFTKFFGSNVEAATHATSFFGDAIDFVAGVSDEAAAKQREMDDAVRDAGLAMLDAEANSDAFATALERLNESSSLDFAQMAQDTVGSFDEVKGALDGIEGAADIDWSNFDITPDEYSELKGMPDSLKAVTDAVSGMRGSIQTELQAAFDSGGIDAYSEKAEFFANEILSQFPQKFRDMGASEEEAQAQTQALLADLGLLPEDVEIVIKLTREEEARNALAAFQGFIDTLPEDVQVAINTKIAEGDIEGAKALLDTELISHGYPPILLPVDAEIEAARDKMEGLTEEERTAIIGTTAETLTASGALTDLTDEERLATIAAVAETLDAATDLTNLTDAERTALINSIAETLVASGQLDDVAAKKRAAEIVAHAETTAAVQALDALAAKQRTAHINVMISKEDRSVHGGTVGPDGGIAGEAGAEFIRLPGHRQTRLLTSESYVPPGTRVTSAARTRAILRGLPRYAAGTEGELAVAVVWKQILQTLDRLTTLTAEGNDTASDVGKMLDAIDLNEAGAESINKVAMLLGALTDEMQSGNAGGQEAIDNMKATLSLAIKESALMTGVVRFEDGSFGPENPAWIRFEDGSFGPVVAAIEQSAAEVVKPTEIKTKEDPNTPILQKISNTLLDMASWDKTASSMLMGQLMLVLRESDNTLDPAVRAAAMTIRAGRA